MKHMSWIIILLIFAGLQLTACSPTKEKAKKINPVKLESIKGTDFKRVILTENAAKRIDVQTAPVSGKSIPYAALIYDTKGRTYVYTNPEPLVFVRQSVAVDRIESDRALLSQELASNTSVVTVGVSELYGAETGVSK